MLLNGLNWLSAKQKKHVSSKVVYCRDDAKHSVDAVLGRTTFKSADENGFTITSHTIDFIIAASDLPLVPESGDLVDEIAEFIKTRELSELPAAQWVNLLNDPLHVPEHLSQKRAFTSVLSLKYLLFD